MFNALLYSGSFYTVALAKFWPLLDSGLCNSFTVMNLNVFVCLNVFTKMFNSQSAAGNLPRKR